MPTDEQRDARNDRKALKRDSQPKAVQLMKEQAKHLKRNSGCTHSEALETIAKQHGYRDWNTAVTQQTPAHELRILGAQGTGKPAYDPNAQSQYHLWYMTHAGIDTVIESTGYLPTLAAALLYVRSRYKDRGHGIAIQPCYPHAYEIKFDVLSGRPVK